VKAKNLKVLSTGRFFRRLCLKGDSAMRNRLVLIWFVCVILLVNAIPVSAEGHVPPDGCTPVNYKVPIRAIDPEERTIQVLVSICYVVMYQVRVYWRFIVTDSTMIKIAGQSGPATFEDLSTSGQEINYTYFYDEAGQRIADNIVIHLLE